MARILWYYFGDIDCFMRGGAGGGTELADALAQLHDDGQNLIDNTGSGGRVPGIVPMVTDLIASTGERDPGIPAWTPDDWPIGWEINFMEPTQTGVDSLVLQPGVISYKWPPHGGGSLSVSLANVQPALGDPHTITGGDLLMQTIDHLVTTVNGRAQVTAAAGGGSVDDVDLVELIKKVEPDLDTGGQYPLPSSFTARFQEVRQTTKTYLDVNPANGVHMTLGWKMVPGTVPTPPDGPEIILLKEYPCGGFVLDPANS